MVENTVCFKSKFQPWILHLIYWVAVKYLYHSKNRYNVGFTTELISTKRWIVKVQRKASVNRVEYFSIHHREESNSHGGTYSWYYEKYNIVPTTDSPVKFILSSYGHYPYFWE